MIIASYFIDDQLVQFNRFSSSDSLHLALFSFVVIASIRMVCKWENDCWVCSNRRLASTESNVSNGNILCLCIRDKRLLDLSLSHFNQSFGLIAPLHWLLERDDCYQFYRDAISAIHIKTNAAFLCELIEILRTGYAISMVVATTHSELISIFTFNYCKNSLLSHLADGVTAVGVCFANANCI